ncbi:hypothetical protein KP509_12G056600 [Ceratopteris richardii]|uniref:Uncharacterized protein n=1 Tax=Ceratopteris richardii TaxID=49495 RepID=A0A8T2TSE4_CERRI|nr:hypothetical protein KP509_12G056600 [Ceratopteris richardii]
MEVGFEGAWRCSLLRSVSFTYCVGSSCREEGHLHHVCTFKAVRFLCPTLRSFCI